MQSSPNTTGSMSESTSGMGGEIRANVEQLSNSAGNRIHSELDARKGTAANQVRSLSSAIGQTAGQLDDGAPQWLKSAFQQGAQQAQRFADTLEQKDSRAILNDIQTMARNNPGTFLAGCAAIGFAAARIMKAGGSQSSPAQAWQPQTPPAQMDEPMFRSSSSDASLAQTTPGEFV
jgi:hypothetical protein